LAVTKYFEILRKYAVNVKRKIDITVPNDSHNIIHCKYDRLVRQFSTDVDYNSRKDCCWMKDQ
jgi:hypothetical protein